MANTERDELLVRLATLAGVLPSGTINSLGGILERCQPGNWPDTRFRAQQVTTNPTGRAAILSMCDAWQSGDPESSPASVALALRAAAVAHHAERDAHRAEVIWTGPTAASVPLRRTDQALLEVITSARRTLLMVSFAVYRVPAVANALIEAIGRGVATRICLESPESGEHGPSYDPAIALGSAVCNSASIYVWPQEQRAATDRGRLGSLHAKCAVADERLLFISSANLTKYALERNIELGLLIDDPRLASTVVSQFDRLIGSGTLIRRTFD